MCKHLKVCLNIVFKFYKSYLKVFFKTVFKFHRSKFKAVLELSYNCLGIIYLCSSSSCQSGSGSRSRGNSGKRRQDLYKIDTDENEYETIPTDISANYRYIYRFSLFFLDCASHDTI